MAVKLRPCFFEVWQPDPDSRSSATPQDSFAPSPRPGRAWKGQMPRKVVRLQLPERADQQDGRFSAADHADRIPPP